ncbi:MAG: hypothetical protein ACJ790_06270 [Myxococcaceae bacterium]
MTVPADVLAAADRRARAAKKSRSAVFSEWLRAGRRSADAGALDQELEAYYGRADEDREALSRALTREARKVKRQK